MTLKAGSIMVLTNLNGMLNGLKVSINTIEEDDEGTTFEVKLLEVPTDTCYKVGDVISVHRYEIKEPPK